MPQIILLTASKDHDTGRTEICLFVNNEVPFDKLNPSHEVHYNISFNETQVSNRDFTVIKSN